MVVLARNHYRVLGVAPDATTDEIERVFRQMARRLHPDVNGGDGAAEERMKELNVARTTLTDVVVSLVLVASPLANEPTDALPPLQPLIHWL